MQKPELPVLLVAGEKCCDLAFKLFKGAFNTITWQGGEGAISKSDFQDLKGRDVILFPDNDEQGNNTIKAMPELAKQYEFQSLKIVN